MAERLTTLAAVKEWLDLEESEGSDNLLNRLIDAASQFALNWMNRSTFQAQAYTENFRGNGQDSMLLRNWPVLSITSVGVAGSMISASTFGTAGFPSSGYRVSDFRGGPQSLELAGYSFYRGAPGQVIYRAGFETLQDVQLGAPVDAEAFIRASVPLGVWSGDLGVTSNDVALTKTALEDPASGHYYVDQEGVYRFNADLEDQHVLIHYSYIPTDVAFAVTELVGEKFKRKDRIGIVSKNLGGQESVTYSQNDLTPSIREVLQPYKNVVPI